MNLSKATTRLFVCSKSPHFVQSGGHRGFVPHFNGLQTDKKFSWYFALCSLLFRESILGRIGKEPIVVADIVYLMGGAEIETFSFV